MTSAAYVAALKPLLEARPGLAGVTVHYAWTADVTAPAIVLVRGRVEHDVQWIAMGPKRQDDVTVPGIVFAAAATVDAAADTALDICAEIAAAITPAAPTVGAQTQKAQLSRVAWAPFPSDKGGWLVECELDITYTADIA